MDINSLSGVASTYGYANQIRNKSVSSSSFVNTLKEAYSLDNAVSIELSFEDTLKAKYPGAKYHVMDASKISQGTWERNGFPFEKFFEDDIDESVLNWTPTGKDPDMVDSCVQARLDSTLGGTLTKMFKVQVKLGRWSRGKTLGMTENTGFTGSVVANWLHKSVIYLLSE